MGIISFFSRLFNSSKFSFGDIKDSEVNIYENCDITERPSFDLSNEWFKKILDKYYDDEIKSKYIPQLHQDTRFEELHLLDILDFDEYLIDYCNILNHVVDGITHFKGSFNSLNSYLETEEINFKEDILESDLKFKDYPKILADNLDHILNKREYIVGFFNNRNYSILEKLKEIQEFDFYGLSEINYSVDDWVRFLDKEPNHQLFYHNFRLFNTVVRNLEHFNSQLKKFKSNFNHKIIAGSAGTGKSHYLACLVNRVTQNDDLAISLKPKSFSDDSVNFEERLLGLLEVPKGYILSEVLEKLNDFSKNNKKRCFIFIDALNETTKSNIGFSNIWKIYLQNFINQIKNYPHLYFVCSLRTSYIEMIWDSNPNQIAEIKGFENRIITKKACEKYFDYYKINPSNLDSADISIFRTPLLLDLFCKLKNSARESEVELTIDIESYLKIFQDYLKQLINEVKKKLDFAATTSIEDGFYKNSTLFYNLNKDFLSINQFVSSFDLDPMITNDKSIARAVWEGYLIFVKEIINNDELIKHSYQEVGGFLLATKLSTDFPNINDLISSQDFIDKIIGTNQNTHHQLRLDILKFLIAIRPEIIPLIQDNDSILLSWDFLINSSNTIYDNIIPQNILQSADNNEVLNYILNKSELQWFNKNSATNFSLISNILNSKSVWNIDLTWGYYIYKDFDYIIKYINYFNTVLKDKDEEDRGELAIAALFASNILTTTIRELRDKATKFLIEYGIQYPLELLDLAIRFSNFNDIYIYERLVSCCYGVMLICQNDKKYIQEFLPKIANELFELQFSENPKAPKYNYIVLDSIKHLLDFAFENGAIDFSEEEYIRICNYEFVPPFEWLHPTEEQQDSINASYETSWPEPIGMDFGIYTIPRLIRKDKENNRRKAIANVYKRIFELGYEELDLKDSKEEKFKEFVRGHKIYGIDGKVDRLGKKYSWIAFFDYAGYLLLNKKLNVFDKTDNGKKYYSRLADVDIDISLPNTNYDISLRLYNDDLLKFRDSNLKWYEEIKIDTIKELFEKEIEDNYTMLYGFVEQRTSEDYKVRSFLMVETIFVEKNDGFEKLKKESDVMDWSSDIHVSRDHSRNCYFGELYWADTIPDSDKDYIYISTGEKIKGKRKKTIYDIFRDKQFNREVDDSEIDEIRDIKISLNSEATLIDYLWETDSELLKGFGEYFPSGKMGKHLNLKADCSTGKILDKDLNEAYKCIHYEDDSFFKNTFNYMRSDLIKKYMAENNVALLYQVKQHSYDEDLLHNRKLKFFIVE
jgi:hypothetical protein